MYIPLEVIGGYGDMIMHTATIGFHHVVAGEKGGITDIVTKLYFYANDVMSGAGSL